jgi:hypothetical protein
LEERFPLFTREFGMVPKRVIPKAMGLLARGYLDLYDVGDEVEVKDKALRCLDWLVRHACRGYSGLCWGYPFDWQTVILIPAGTPCAVVSSIAGDAFWKAYGLFKEKRFLDVCRSICEFFVNDLQIDEIEPETLCFSYTPLDDFHVHNANLFVAEFLTRVGKEIGNVRYLKMGARAANYALREQNREGALYYWGKAQDHYSPHHIDHYHSGFEIRMLYGMWKLTGDERYRRAVRRYYRFYRDNLFVEECVPKMAPEHVYPINIQSCAEAILCNATLAEELEEARELLPRVVAWTVERMQTRAGWFIYMIRSRKEREREVWIPYIRWGQACMLRALGQSYSVLSRGMSSSEALEGKPAL